MCWFSSNANSPVYLQLFLFSYSLNLQVLLSYLSDHIIEVASGFNLKSSNDLSRDVRSTYTSRAYNLSADLHEYKILKSKTINGGKKAKKNYLRVSGMKPKNLLIFLHIRIPSPQFESAIYCHQFNYNYEIDCSDSWKWPNVYVEEELHFCSNKFYKGSLKFVFNFVLIRIFRYVTRLLCLLGLI